MYALNCALHPLLGGICFTIIDLYSGTVVRSKFFSQIPADDTLCTIVAETMAERKYNVAGTIFFFKELELLMKKKVFTTRKARLKAKTGPRELAMTNLADNLHRLGMNLGGRMQINQFIKIDHFARVLKVIEEEHTLELKKIPRVPGARLDGTALLFSAVSRFNAGEFNSFLSTPPVDERLGDAALKSSLLFFIYLLTAWAMPQATTALSPFIPFLIVFCSFLFFVNRHKILQKLFSAATFLAATAAASWATVNGQFQKIFSFFNPASQEDVATPENPSTAVEMEDRETPAPSRDKVKSWQDLVTSLENLENDQRDSAPQTTNNEDQEPGLNLWKAVRETFWLFNGKRDNLEGEEVDYSVDKLYPDRPEMPQQSSHNLEERYLEGDYDDQMRQAFAGRGAMPAGDGGNQAGPAERREEQEREENPIPQDLSVDAALTCMESFLSEQTSDLRGDELNELVTRATEKCSDIRNQLGTSEGRSWTRVDTLARIERGDFTSQGKIPLPAEIYSATSEKIEAWPAFHSLFCKWGDQDDQMSRTIAPREAEDSPPQAGGGSSQSRENNPSTSNAAQSQSRENNPLTSNAAARRIETDSSDDSVLLSPNFQYTDMDVSQDNVEAIENPDGTTVFRRPGTLQAHRTEE